MLRTLVIRPGLLVSLKTSIRGGVSYQRRDLAAETAAEVPETAAAEAARIAVSTWETTRTIADVEEHRRAVEVRGRCRTIIARHCIASTFGMLCPQSREAELQAAVSEAQALAAEFNAGARFSRVDVLTLTGRVAADDVQAARAIGSEVRELVASMEAGIRAADPDAIREAASKARALAGMLSPEVAGKVSASVEAARAAAREIVRRVERDGERAADVVRSIRLEAFDLGRFPSLDLDGGAEVAPVLAVESRAVDLQPDDTPAEVAAPAPAARGLDLADLDDGAERIPVEMLAAAVGMVPALDFAGA